MRLYQNSESFDRATLDVPAVFFFPVSTPPRGLFNQNLFSDSIELSDVGGICIIRIKNRRSSSFNLLFSYSPKLYFLSECGLYF